MPSLDPTVAHVLDTHHTKATDSDDEDALIAELEADDDGHAFSQLREKRIQQLHDEISRTATLKQRPGHGLYQEIKDEKELMDITTSTHLCVVHFMKPDFTRCRVMDAKLAVLAEKHYDTRFVSINVDNAPFLVVKLGIQVLPCVLAFKDGVSSDRIIGFEGIGYKPDTFTVQALEARLLRSGVLVRAKMVDGDEQQRRGRREGEEREREEVWDEDEWE